MIKLFLLGLLGLTLVSCREDFERNCYNSGGYVLETSSGLMCMEKGSARHRGSGR